MNCKIIQDILPLYADGLASEESVQLVEEHMEGCAECRTIYEKMTAPDEMSPTESRDIGPLKKVRLRNIVKIVLISIGGAAVLAVLFLALFWGLVPAKSSDVTVSYSAYRSDSGDYVVDFDFATADGKALEFSEDIREEPFNVVTMTPRRAIHVKWLNNGNQYLWGWDSFRPFTEEDILVVKFRDCQVTYSMKEIAEEFGIQ